MRLSCKQLIISVIGVFFINLGVAQAETLQEAVQYMLQTHPQIKAGSYNRLAKDQEIGQAKAGYYPSLNITGSMGMTKQSHPYYYNTWPNSTILSLNQNLFRFGGTYYDVKRVKLNADSQAYLLQGSSEDISLLVSKVYLDTLRSLELLDLSKENLINHQKISDQMTLRSTSGVDRKADLDQVMGRLALAQSNVVIAEGNLIDARTAYQAAIGRLPENLTRPQLVGAVIPDSMDEAERLALEGYPILKSAQADLDARKAQYQAAKSQLFPTIDLGANYIWQNDTLSTGYDSGYNEYWTVTLSASFNIFNGGYNKARISQTAQQIREAEEIFNNTKRQIIQSVRLSWEAYKTAKEKVDYLEEYVKSTGLTASAFTAQWNIGRRTMFDLLDTQAEYITAKASLVNAQYDEAYAELRVLNILGKLVNALGLQRPEASRVENDNASSDTPQNVEPQQQKDSTTVAPLTTETPKPAEPEVAVPSEAETPKPAEPAVAAPPEAETPKPAEPAVINPEPIASPDQNIKGVVLMDGKTVEGKILDMDSETVRILTKEGKEESFSFEKEVKGFIKE